MKKEIKRLRKLTGCDLEGSDNKQKLFKLELKQKEEKLKKKLKIGKKKLSYLLYYEDSVANIHIINKISKEQWQSHEIMFGGLIFSYIINTHSAFPKPYYQEGYSVLSKKEALEFVNIYSTTTIELQNIIKLNIDKIGS